MPKHTFLLIPVLFAAIQATAQSYAPAAGLSGSTALHKNDVSFVAWAKNVSIIRGYKKITDPSLGLVTTGVAENAIGFPTGAVVSLGDGGEAIVTFNKPIINGPGFDFAVFENGNIGYLELGIVKVSSDGINFFGFPNHSQTPTNAQIGTFGTPSASFLHNLAGKYEGSYGTPFDLNDIPDNPLLDKQKITHVKIIDVVGSIDPAYATYDSFGNAINDSYPTPFDSGGFDLQAVGVIHQQVLGTDDFEQKLFSFYPNPASETVFFDMTLEAEIKLYDLSGRLVKVIVEDIHDSIKVSDLPNGVYIIEITSDLKIKREKLIIKH
ncbi:T9SS type A sorting domain-containing protein [Flavobacterium amniphilum]|uniref:T9SS type A sorting domain-containing protein n=1 Tax=Flavobacterium amniphilum TaxID=1834035 RepID=UPI00202A4803|nr:T9SS type A sorting domain-containing protein [Flavobacterium amniphilum]MCL9807231.1 T9SS type A sorting domain-containing protein [Flavobacterium amniphilum]